MSDIRALQDAGKYALELLSFTSAAADAFPPLKSAAGSALYIAQAVKNFKSNKEDWINFATYVQDAVTRVVQSLVHANKLRDDLEKDLQELNITLENVHDRIKALRAQSTWTRIKTFVKDPEEIIELKAKVDNAIKLFELQATITTGIDVAKILDAVKNKLDKKISDIVVSATLEKLPYALGASWDPGHMCLPGTRTSLLDKVQEWANSCDSHSKQIFWLTGVAGSGKSAIAHSVAKQCYDSGLLVSSFFFDHATAGRNAPGSLFSTFAYDLAKHHGGIAGQITLALEEDRSLASASLSRQFEHLILQPCLQHHLDQPIVFVIDALDEGYSKNKDLLKILQDGVLKLPKYFHIFITSREEDDIVFYMSNQPHVQRMTIDTMEQSNQKDVLLYAQARLEEIAIRSSLETDWPGQETLEQISKEAEGLFLWGSTICDYLAESLDPNEELGIVLSKPDIRNVPAEKKMDELYSVILSGCNWRDASFVKTYGLVMGIIMVAKTPISMAAMQNILGNTLTLPVITRCLQQFSSLLVGLAKPHLPIKVLHQSFAEFITIRAQLLPSKQHFHIEKDKHNQKLALLCLQVLNKGLAGNLDGTSYLGENYPDVELHSIPEIKESQVSEELWYACKFWMDHVLDVATPTGDLFSALEIFFSTYLIKWIEVIVGKGNFQKLSKLWHWHEAKTDQMKFVFNHGVWKRLMMLADLLTYVDRLEDSLEVYKEAVWICQILSSDSSEKFNVDLALSLNKLSSCLSSLGHHEEALAACQQAIDLCEALAADRPVIFSADLAMSLTNISNCLLSLGLHEKALPSCQQAVDLYKALAVDRPAEFNADLAASLNNLSNHLWSLGHHEEALVACQQTINLYKALAADTPATFNADLARSLSNLSNYLSSLGHHEEALATCQQAIDLYKVLVVDRPAAYNANLARTLNNLSNRLLSLGHHEEALAACQQAVEFYKALAAERPAAFKADLAMSLTNLSNCLLSFGHHEEALVACQQAVDLYKALAADRPVAFNMNLAISLNNLSYYLTYFGHHEEALAACQQAVDLLKALAVHKPEELNANLAMPLANLSNHLSSLGHHKEALSACQQAVDLYKALVAERPAAFSADLAMSLNNLSNHLSSLGHNEEALAAGQQAVDLYKSLAAERPAAFNSNLAMSLNAISYHLASLGHHEEALAACQQATDLYKVLAADRPAAFNANVALCLNNLSNHMSSLGHHKEALAACQQAIDLYKALAADRPATFNANVALCLTNLSNHLSSLNHYEEALAACQQAVDLYKGLAAERPVAFDADLAMCLNKFSNHLSSLCHNEEAIE